MAQYPRNEAFALHSILEKLHSRGNVAVATAWPDVLDANLGSSEFTRRHSEVVRLVGAVAERAQALSIHDATRRQVDRYLGSWYAAVINQAAWGGSPSAPPAHKAIDEPSLLALESVADAFTYKFSDGDADLSEDSVERLRKSIDDWMKVVESGALPDEVATQIRAHIEGILWLLDNVDRFGYQPVIREARGLIGMAVGVMSRIKLRKRTRRAFWYAIGGLVFVFGNPLQDGGMLTLLDNNVEAVANLYAKYESIDEILHASPKQLEPAPPKELEAPIGQRAIDRVAEPSVGDLDLEDGHAECSADSDNREG